MKSGTSKIKKSFLSDEELHYLETISEKDPTVKKLFGFYQSKITNGADKFIAAMHASLAKLADKIEELGDINFEDNTTHQAHEKYDLLIRLSKDGTGIAKMLSEIEKNKNPKSVGRPKSVDQTDDDDDQGEEELELEDGDELLDENNPDHKRSVVDTEADRIRQNIKNKAQQG